MAHEDVLFRVEAVFTGGDGFKAAEARLLAATHRLPEREPVLVGWVPEGEPNRYFFPMRELYQPGSAGDEDVPESGMLRALFQAQDGRYYLVSISPPDCGPRALGTVEELVGWDAEKWFARLPFKYVSQLSED